MATGSGAERYGSSTVDKAVDILTVIAASPAGLTNQEVSAELGFDKSTVHRLLLTLERRGLLARTGVPARFVVGDHAQFLAWGPTPDLRVVLAPVLEELVDLTGESASYSIRQGDRFTCVAHRLSLHDLSYSPLTGQSYPLGSAASGLALLAFLAAPVRDEIVARSTLPPADAGSDAGDLRAELELIVQRGYATSGGHGGCSIAYPVLGRHGTVVGALAISAAEVRTPLAELAAQAETLAEAAHCLPADLGWVPSGENPSEPM
ncbi:IclR family transcriptional regulator [Kribbella sp.]|uniref:IclR family transcriptional regulator n=1 Tax=Kribbella sp. TaxID=1871183 RepID=UPI002D57AAD9|nr:IclR family transcriptional regulator [Kribbella sp.]HZX08749.1 IclR family transcriptional regulator [Kribbella sp.]